MPSVGQRILQVQTLLVCIDIVKKGRKVCCQNLSSKNHGEGIFFLQVNGFHISCICKISEGAKYCSKFSLGLTRTISWEL